MSRHTASGNGSLSFQPGKGFRKDAGKERNARTGRVTYKRFWLGHDRPKAERLAKLILDEWELIRVHGGDVWTAEALRRIQLAKSGATFSSPAPPTPPAPAAPLSTSPPPPPRQGAMPAPTGSADDATAPPATPPTAPRSAATGAASSGKSLYTAMMEYESAAERDAKSGQISRGRWANVSYAMRRLRFAMADQPLAHVGYDEIRRVVNYFAARPVSPATGRKLAADTAIDTLTFARAFFANLADRGEWRPPTTMEALFKFHRDKLFTDAELDRKQHAPAFTIAELAMLWRRCGDDRQQLLFLLALNCGFTQSDVASLRRASCHLDRAKPRIVRRRGKTRVPGRWRLWPETAALLRKVMAGTPHEELVMLGRRGRPLVYYDGRYRYDAVRTEWEHVLDRAQRAWEMHEKRWGGVPERLWERGYRAPGKVRRLSFKYLRKTGGNLVRRLGGREQSEVYLAHADPKMARPYTNKDFAALGRTLMRLRRQLIPVLGPLPKASANRGVQTISHARPAVLSQATQSETRNHG